MDPLTSAWVREYEFLQAFPGYTHDNYLDLPAGDSEWLLRVHRIMKEHEQRANNQANGGSQPQRGVPDIS